MARAHPRMPAPTMITSEMWFSRRPREEGDGWPGEEGGESRIIGILRYKGDWIAERVVKNVGWLFERNGNSH